MYHWIDVLDLFDSILEEACIKTGTWMLNCDKTENAEVYFKNQIFLLDFFLNNLVKNLSIRYSSFFCIIN